METFPLGKRIEMKIEKFCGMSYIYLIFSISSCPWQCDSYQSHIHLHLCGWNRICRLRHKVRGGSMSGHTPESRHMARANWKTRYVVVTEHVEELSSPSPTFPNKFFRIAIGNAWHGDSPTQKALKVTETLLSTQDVLWILFPCKLLSLTV